MSWETALYSAMGKVAQSCPFDIIPVLLLRQWAEAMGASAPKPLVAIHPQPVAGGKAGASWLFPVNAEGKKFGVLSLKCSRLLILDFPFQILQLLF